MEVQKSQTSDKAFCDLSDVYLIYLDSNQINSYFFYLINIQRWNYRYLRKNI